MVRVAASRRSGHSPLFSMDDCLKAVDAKWGTTAVDIGVAGSDTERRQQICEKVFQSSMFQRAQGSRTWVFADPHGADVFEARWLAGEVARSQGVDCGTLAKFADQLAEPEVLKFFAGEPMGLRCLGHAVAAACGSAPTRCGRSSSSEALPSGCDGGSTMWSTPRYSIRPFCFSPQFFFNNSLSFQEGRRKKKVSAN